MESLSVIKPNLKILTNLTKPKITIEDIPIELLEQIQKDAIRKYLLSTGRGRKPKTDSYKKRIKKEQNRKNVLKRNEKLGIIGLRKKGRKPKNDPNEVIVKI